MKDENAMLVSGLVKSFGHTRTLDGLNHSVCHNDRRCIVPFMIARISNEQGEMMRKTAALGTVMVHDFSGTQDRLFDTAELAWHPA